MCSVGQSSLGRVRVVVAEPVVWQAVWVGARGHLTPLQAHSNSSVCFDHTDAFDIPHFWCAQSVQITVTISVL